MSKGQETRKQIIQRAAELFNKRGYHGSSISDLMECTGLQKGGIYRHFENKEQLALEAFEYAKSQYTSPLEQAMAQETNGLAKLQAFAKSFYSIATQPPLGGGCPVMNTIVENDDGDPALRMRARAAISHWQQLLEDAIQLGISQGSIKADLEAQRTAAVIIASLEGGILLSRAHQNINYMQYNYEHVLRFIETDVAA